MEISEKLILLAKIGDELAKNPEQEIEHWPPHEICEIIESINTESLKGGFISETFNKQGATTRGVFDGGEIETKRAEHYDSLNKKHKIKYPNVASMFLKIAKSYKYQAKREDEEAERRKLEY